jgi:integrase
MERRPTVEELAGILIRVMKACLRRLRTMKTVSASHRKMVMAVLRRMDVAGHRAAEKHSLMIELHRECNRIYAAAASLGTGLASVGYALSGLRFHDLRHQAITELAERSQGDQTIMSIAGHVSQEMLNHYSHIRMESKRRALKTLEEPLMVASGSQNDTATPRPN